MSATSQSLVTVVVDGKPIGTWDTRSGGESTAEVSKRRPGGSSQEKATRGRGTIGDITVGRERERERDIALESSLRPRVGRAQMVVIEQPLDDDDIPWGKPTTWTGILSSVTPGDYDSDSDDPRMMELGMVATAVS